MRNRCCRRYVCLRAAGVWVGALAFLFGTTQVWATSVPERSLEELVVEADRAVVATVVGVRSGWRDAGHGGIDTRVSFDDVRVLWGEAAPDLTLTFPGGTVGDIHESVGGIPRFRPGERVVLLLRDGTGISPVAGFHQGCFRTTRDGGGVRVVLPRRYAESGLAASREGGPRVGRTAAVPIDEFLETLRSTRGRITGEGR